MKLSVKVRIKDKSTFGTLSEMAEEMSQAERSLYRRMLVDPDCMVLLPASSMRCACRSKGDWRPARHQLCVNTIKWRQSSPLPSRSSKRSRKSAKPAPKPSRMLLYCTRKNVSR